MTLSTQRLEKAAEAVTLPDNPVMAFAYLVSKCGNGLIAELMSDGKTETQAKNAVVHLFLDFASGEACRIARREGREPDHSKWTKAADRAFERAVKRTISAELTERDAG